MRKLLLGTALPILLATLGQARADFINFAQFGPTGTSVASGSSGTTLNGVGFTISNPGSLGFSEYCEDKNRACGGGYNTWAGEFQKNEVILFNNSAPSPVTINFNSPIYSLNNLQAQANNYGAFTETLTAFNGTTQVGFATADWFNGVYDLPGEGTIPRLSVASQGGITSIEISTTNDGDGFALGGAGGFTPPPTRSEFLFTEVGGENGAPGHYTIVNNSVGWWVTGFTVTNPLAGNPYMPWTTQQNWTAGLCDSCGVGFSYSDGVAGDFANYIAPEGGSSSNFFFGAPPASSLNLFLTNADGQTTMFTYGSAAPEASTWAMLLAGFAGLGLMARRRVRTVAVAG